MIGHPRRWAVAVAVAAALFASVLARADDLFAVSGVAVDVTAASAEEARTQALADGQRQAWTLLMQRLVPTEYQGPLLGLNDTEVTDLVSAYEVEDEKVAPDRYIAHLTYRFKEPQVRQLFQMYSAPYVIPPDGPYLVLPVWEGEAGPLLFEDGNPWREAWNAAPPSQGIVTFVLPIGDLPDLAAVDGALAVSGNPQALAALAARYGAAAVVVARASRAAGSEDLPRIDVTLQTVRGEAVEIGSDSFVGSVGQTDEQLMADAVVELRRAIDEAWKARNVLTPDMADQILVAVPMKGLADWTDLRTRISALPIVQRVDVGSLRADGATVTLHFFGDVERLRGSLAGQGLTLEENTEGWTLRRATEATLQGSDTALP